MAKRGMSEPKRYACHAYLLRCWQEGGDLPEEATHWRYSVEKVLDKQPRRGFDDLEALFRFLRDEMARGQDGPPA